MPPRLGDTSNNHPSFPTTQEIHDDGRFNTRKIIEIRGEIAAKQEQVDRLQMEIRTLQDKMCFHADKAAEAIIKLHERT